MSGRVTFEAEAGSPSGGSLAQQSSQCSGQGPITITRTVDPGPGRGPAIDKAESSATFQPRSKLSTIYTFGMEPDQKHEQQEAGAGSSTLSTRIDNSNVDTTHATVDYDTNFSGIGGGGGDSTAAVATSRNDLLRDVDYFALAEAAIATNAAAVEDGTDYFASTDAYAHQTNQDQFQTNQGQAHHQHQHQQQQQQQLWQSFDPNSLMDVPVPITPAVSEADLPSMLVRAPSDISIMEDSEVPQTEAAFPMSSRGDNGADSSPSVTSDDCSSRNEEDIKNIDIVPLVHTEDDSDPISGITVPQTEAWFGQDKGQEQEQYSDMIADDRSDVELSVHTTASDLKQQLENQRQAAADQYSQLMSVVRDQECRILAFEKTSPSSPLFAQPGPGMNSARKARKSTTASKQKRKSNHVSNSGVLHFITDDIDCDIDNASLDSHASMMNQPLVTSLVGAFQDQKRKYHAKIDDLLQRYV
jgi:hypothetical protein